MKTKLNKGKKFSTNVLTCISYKKQLQKIYREYNVILYLCTIIPLRLVCRYSNANKLRLSMRAIKKKKNLKLYLYTSKEL